MGHLLAKQRTKAAIFLMVTGLMYPSQGFAAEAITKTGLSVVIQDFVQMPATGSSPLARINFLREEPLGSDRLFVNDLTGFLYTLDKSTQAVSTYVDFTSTFPNLKTSPGYASGLITFAFHPEFATNGKFYTAHSENISGATETPVIVPPAGDVSQHNVLLEWVASDPASDTFSGTRREIMRVGALGPAHPMGDLGFNPLATPEDVDYGMLYVAIGDGYSYHFGLEENLQRVDSFLGTILRIDPDPNGQPVPGDNGQYSIPASNPWAADGNANTFGEIYDYGFRNPHRLTWDSATGAMFANDIGEDNIDEIDLIEPGQNYGWPVREGTFLLDGSPLPLDDAGFAYPVAQYDHTEGFAISSGFAYRGSGIPALDGKFVFGDIANGRIFYSDIAEMIAADDGIAATTATIHELQLVQNGIDRNLKEIISDALGAFAGRADLRLATDEAGELLVMTKQDGFIRKLLLKPGDYDYDLDVDASDLSVWESRFGMAHPDGDGDGDGEVTGQDFLIWQRHLGGATNIATVPEPKTALQLIFCVTTLILHSLRKRR